MADVLIRKSRDDTGTQTHKEEGHVIMKKEIKVIYLQAEEHKDCQHNHKPGEHGTDSSSEPPKGNNPASTLILDFWPPEL